MAANNDIPPIPLPSSGAAGVPPIEPPPAAAAPGPVVPPAYAPPAAPNPYSQPTAPTAPPAYGYAPGYAPVAAAPQGLSLTSMITGIASIVLALFSLGLFPGIAAVITGHMAQKRQPWARGMWLTGLITGYIGVGISLIYGLIVVLALVAGFAGSNF